MIFNLGLGTLIIPLLLLLVASLRILREYELGASRKRVGIRPNDRAPAREGVEVYKDGKQIGIVTSGGFSPILNGPISMGYVETAHAEPGHVVDLMIRGVPRPATIVPLQSPKPIGT